MIIHSERLVLRQAYEELDQSLEFANAQFRKDDDLLAQALFAAYKEGVNNESICELISHSESLSQRSITIATHLTDAMTAIYKAEEAMKDAQHRAELLIEAIKYVTDPREQS